MSEPNKLAKSQKISFLRCDRVFYNLKYVHSIELIGKKSAHLHIKPVVPHSSDDCSEIEFFTFHDMISKREKFQEDD